MIHPDFTQSKDMKISNDYYAVGTYTDITKYLTIIITLEDWLFIESLYSGKNRIDLIHSCTEGDWNHPRITTHTAWLKQKCTFCDKKVPDDVHSILHTLVRNI